MYHISDSIMEHIDEPHVIGVFVGDSAEPELSSLDAIASCAYNAHFCGGGLTIGALCSANVSISAYGQHDLSGRDIVVKLGFGDAPEWLQLGVFRVCECRVGDDTTSITAYDAAYWATGDEYTPTVQTPTSVRAVLEDVCEQCNITLGSLPATADRVIDGRLTGYTARQIIMHMAAVCGCNALIDRSGALRLKWIYDNGQSIGPDDYYADELTNATTINIVGVQMKTKTITPSTDPDTGITVEREEEKTYSSASGTGRVLAVDCPYANQELVDAVADDVSPLSYAVGSVSFIGGYDVEPGDTLSVTSLSGAVHSVPVLGLTLSLDGGCRATVKAEGYSDTDTSANFDTEYQQALSRLEAAIIAVKNLTADNIEAQSAYIKRLSADEAFIQSIFAHNIKATGTIEGVELIGATGYFREKAQVYGMYGLRTGGIQISIDGPHVLGWNYWDEVAGENPRFVGAGKSLGAITKFPVISTAEEIVVSPDWHGCAIYDSPFVGVSALSCSTADIYTANVHELNAYSATVNENLSVSGTISEGGTPLGEKYAAKSHTHDDRYYTESEVDTKLAGKANATHTHDDRYYTVSEVDTKLAGKANATHTHDSILDALTGTATTFAYGKDGLKYEDYTWLAAWNGYELRAVNKNHFAPADHTHSYLPANGTADKARALVDSGVDALITASYGKAGLSPNDYTWLAAWNGYELRAIHKNHFLSSSGGTVTGGLTVSGTFQPQADIRSQYTYDNTVTNSPNVFITSSYNMRRTTSSSRRYKTDIVDLPINDIRGLYQLPVRLFRYLDNYTSEDDERYRKQIPGFIAEELDAVLPIAVDHRDGKAEMWNSNIMLPCLLRLVQDLNERIETLEKRLEALERKEDCE